MKTVGHIFLYGFMLLLLLGAGAGVGLGFVLWRYGADLPDYAQLANYQPAVMTRVHAGDGQLITEYARQNRMFVPVEAIPEQVIQAFVAAEDQDFFSHGGVDLAGVVRAALTNLRNYAEDRRLVGASTITQQVAKNFLLSGEVSLSRKIKEAILAFRIERAFSKQQVLELYLNEIYLGRASYGVAASALNYFDKSLSELSLEEAAYLAALPKAPNNYHPVRYYDRAVVRRNYVLERMRKDGYITAEAARTATGMPLSVAPRRGKEFVAADYFAEDVRRQLVARYGEAALYEGGLSVRTSLDPHLQAIAADVLAAGLIAYDRRHGWHGAIARIGVGEGSPRRLARAARGGMPDDWRLAVVREVQPDQATIGFEDASLSRLRLADMKWARKRLADAKRGPPVTEVGQVLRPGDVIAVAPPEAEDGGETPDYWVLQQVPEVNGAVIAMDPHTGRVLASQGGFAYSSSEFNRATQARRQPGSAFKPFVYAAALENGFTPSSLVLDAPFVIDQGPGLGLWKPGNYSNKFYGPSTLRLGIEKSRNLMTVRLAQYIGMDRVVEYANRFALGQGMPANLSMALGAGEVTLLELTAAYAMLVNGGRQVQPTLIDRVQDRRGKTIYRYGRGLCEGCVGGWASQGEPLIPDVREQRIDPATAYQLVSMLEGVVQRGTARRVSSVGKPLAGKTGTTNESRDTWFIGFSPDLVVGVFVGFDTPRTLGKRETGSSVAAPIFRDFAARALADAPAIPFRIPSGIRLVRVDGRTGLPARPGDTGVILEAFRTGTEPTGRQLVLDGIDSGIDVRPAVAVGSGGLY